MTIGDKAASAADSVTDVSSVPRDQNVWQAAHDSVVGLGQGRTYRTHRLTILDGRWYPEFHQCVRYCWRFAPPCVVPGWLRRPKATSAGYRAVSAADSSQLCPRVSSVAGERGRSPLGAPIRWSALRRGAWLRVHWLRKSVVQIHGAGKTVAGRGEAARHGRGPTLRELLPTSAGASKLIGGRR